MAASKSFFAISLAYCAGTFNDNLIKQAALLLAVTSGAGHLQGPATVLFALPFVLFSVFGGWAADTFNKRSVVLAAKTAEICAVGLSLFGFYQMNWNYILTAIFLMGLQATFFSPAINSTLAILYTAEELPKANALLKLVTTLAILLGIAVAGIALESSVSLQLTADPGKEMLGSVAIIVGLLGLISSWYLNQSLVPTSTRPFPKLGPIQSVLDVLSLRTDTQLFVALSADAFFYFLATAVVLAINALGLQQLHLSKTLTSVLAVALMLGICLGSFVASAKITVAKWSSALWTSAAGMSVSLLIVHLPTTLLSHLPTLVQFSVFSGIFVITGLAAGIFLIPVASFIQHRPTVSEKGRIQSAANFLAFVSILASGILYSWLSARFQPSVVLGLLGSLAAAYSIFAYCVRQKLHGVSE